MKIRCWSVIWSDKRSYFSVDDAYNLIIDGFILLIIGVEDDNHSFKPVVFSIVMKEDIDSNKNVVFLIKKNI